MQVPKPVRSWVADAEARHGPALDDDPPLGFAWREFCADAPVLAERLGQAWKGAAAPAARARLEDLAQAAFRGGYCAGIALLAAYDAAAEPDAALARLAAPLSDDEAERLGDSLASDLGAVEARLDGEEDVPLSARAGAGLRAAAAVREAVRALLADGLASGVRQVVSLGAGPGPLDRVLSGVVTVAVALAGLRHALVAEADEAAGAPALLLDRVALASALGPDAGSEA